MSITTEQLELMLEELEDLRREMEEKVARAFAADNDLNYWKLNYDTGIKYWRAQSFTRLFREYEKVLRQEEHPPTPGRPPQLTEASVEMFNRLRAGFLAEQAGLAGGQHG
jgi:hypothetical protein